VATVGGVGNLAGALLSPSRPWQTPDCHKAGTMHSYSRERHTCEMEVEAKLADAAVTCCEEDMTVNSRQIDGAELRNKIQCAHETEQHSVSESMRQSETSWVAHFSVTRLKDG
jgi:hypothetical protein